jgi:hypothetical protein
VRAPYAWVKFPASEAFSKACLDETARVCLCLWRVTNATLQDFATLFLMGGEL